MVLEIVYPTIKNKFNSETEIINIPTGYKELDAVIGGFYPSDLILITGDIVSGKTTFISQLAHNISKYHREKSSEKTEIYLSLQHNKNKINVKLISANCDISPTELIQRSKAKIQDTSIFSIEETQAENTSLDNNLKDFFSLFEESKIQNLGSDKIDNFDDVLIYVKNEAKAKDISVLFIDGLDFINHRAASPDNKTIVWQLAKLKNFATAYDICVVVTCNSIFLELENIISEAKADMIFQIKKETNQSPGYLSDLKQNKSNEDAYWKHSLKILKNNLGNATSLTLEIKKSSGKTEISVPTLQNFPF